ncbi:MAG: class I SAM-dependent methyltransferase [Chloroflexi bacterium]|nr:class I SAM-dependent methyltransferase [Chloroflexota bacterium]
MLTDKAHPHKFDPSWKENLDRPEHRQLDPEQVLDSLPLKPSDQVADVGAGTGFFTIPLARRLSSGKVLALDISPEMLAFLQQKVSRAGVANVEAALCADADFPVAPGNLDGVILFFVLHEAADRTVFLKAVKCLLKPGAWAALMDWEARAGSSSPPGPPLRVRVPPEEARRLALGAGFRVVAERAVGPNYYMLILEG